MKNKMLVFSLLFFSGFYISNSVLGQYQYAVYLLLLLLFFKKKVFRILKLTNVKLLLVVLTLVFILQILVLKYFSYWGAINYYARVVCGIFVFVFVGEKIRPLLFDIIFKLGLISIFSYCFLNYLDIKIPAIYADDQHINYIFYSKSLYHSLRNCGPFWEPGAFASIIVLVLFLNNDIIFDRKNIYRVSIIIIALFLTRSTTGILVFFIMIVGIMINKTSNKYFGLSILLYMFILSSIIILFYSLPYLSEKINLQFVDSSLLNNNEFSNSRFGSAIFDWYYIKKSPFWGNGFSEVTRYEDHPSIIYRVRVLKENLGNGNGITNFAASLGLIYLLTYFFLLYQTSIRSKNRLMILLTVVVFALMIGEQWMFYPLFIGLPFISLENLSKC